MNPSQPRSEAKPMPLEEVSLGLESSVDVSFRSPLLSLFLFSAAWLLLGSAFSLIASIKFHGPDFLAGIGCLTYGRVWPAATNSLLYGFCVPAGIGITMWISSRLGGVALKQRGLVLTGVFFWNIGVALGVVGILNGDSTGFETLEFPAYATVLLLSAYIVLGVSAATVMHERHEKRLCVSQWFALTAWLWFAWIYSTAQVLVTLFPGRGVTPSVISWWYAQNLEVVFLWAMGLAVLFYFVPVLTLRSLHSRHLALFTFWLLVLFGGWAGIPGSAPVPSWMPSLSTAARILLAVTFLSILLNFHLTLGGKWAALWSTQKNGARDDNPTLPFFGVALAAFVLSGLMQVARAADPVAQALEFTWSRVAESRLNNYGFFGLAATGAAYYIVPLLFGNGEKTEVVLSARLIRVHFWCALLGLTFTCVPLALGGVIQGAKLENPNVPFLEITNTTLHFLRISTVGEMLLFFGNFFFLTNLAGATLRFYRVRARRVISGMTDLLRPLEVRP